MKNQIHLSSRSEARTGNARSIISRRDGAWRGLLLAGCCALLTGLAHPARAAVTEAWVQRYSNVVSNSIDQAFKVVTDAAGDIIVTGNSDDGITGQDILTIKYSGADGSVLWQKRYNGPANSDDSAYAVAVDASGNVSVTGSSNNGSNSDSYTAKYAAADGALLWEKRGPTGAGYAVAVDNNGNVVVTGYASNANNPDYYTAKYAAADGALLWEKRGPGGGSQAIAVDGGGNVVVTGYSGNGSDNDYYTAKYAAADGALLWEQRYNGPGNGGDFAYGVAVDGSGNVVVTGISYNANFTDPIYYTPVYYTAKYASVDGRLLWEQHYSGPTDSYGSASAVAVDSSGNVVVTSFSNNGRGNEISSYTAKYAAANGALLWEQRYNGPVNSGGYASAVTVDGSGNVVVTGASGPGSSRDYYTAKYVAADGALLWEKRYNGPSNGEDSARAVAVDVSGNIVVTGSSGGDYYTAKYAAADGALLWEQRYNGPSNGEDYARAVAVDGNGNVLVTGSSYGGGNGSDIYTAKYAAADGALLWEQRYNGPSNGEDYASAVAVDASGNVVVTGASGGDYYAAKYAATNGALLWEKRGPGGGPSAMALDGSGNVVVTGFSRGSASRLDYYTAKYAAADGTLLWEKRSNGPQNDYGPSSAVAADGSGNVVVAEVSHNGANTDYYTAKYAAADGRLLWEKHSNGPADNYGSASAVAIDGSGNVVVAETSYENFSWDRDHYTAKYAAADGTLLWEKHYNSFPPLYFARAVAVDSSGNAVVTGTSGSFQGRDYYTAKYAAADGALLWEQTYDGPNADDGPPNNADVAQAMVLDGSGNVVVTGSSYSVDYNTADYYTAKYAAADGALLWEKRYDGGTANSLALGPNGMIAIAGSSGGDYATVVYREVLPPLSIELVPTGIFLRFTGVPGSTYTIERAASVTGPWTTLNTQTAPASGLLEYLDAVPPVGSAFYRTSAP